MLHTPYHAPEGKVWGVYGEYFGPSYDMSSLDCSWWSYPSVSACTQCLSFYYATLATAKGPAPLLLNLEK